MSLMFNPSSGMFDMVNNTWCQLVDSITASSTKVIDTVPIAEFNSIKYISVFYNVANSLTKSLELSIIDEGGTLRDSVSSRLGGGNIRVNVNLNASNMELEIVNNESFDIEVKLSKLLM